MVVDINKARGKHEAFGVDSAFILVGPKISDSRDVVAGNADAYSAEWCAGSVSNLSIEDDYAGWLNLSAGEKVGGAGQNGDEQQRTQNDSTHWTPRNGR